jgi:hypothetical protein
MLLAIALPVGMLLNYLTGGWENLPDSLLMLMGWMDSPSLLQRHTARLVSALVVPAVLVFLVLKATRLGAWLAPNKLAIFCLLVADAVLLGVALRGLVLASMDASPFVSGTLSAVATPVVLGSLAAGLASLVASTIWHRLVRDKARAASWCKALLREV